MHSHLNREVSTTLVVRAGERIVARKDIVIPARGQLQDAVLWSPRETGEIELTLSLPKEEDEHLHEED